MKSLMVLTAILFSLDPAWSREIGEAFEDLEFLSETYQSDFEREQLKLRGASFFVRRGKAIQSGMTEYHLDYVFDRVKQNLPRNLAEEQSLAELLNHEDRLVRFCAFAALGTLKKRPLDRGGR